MSALREHGQVVLSRGAAKVARLDRRPVPHRLIMRALPRLMPRRFDAEAAGDLDAVLELRVRDPAGGAPGRFALRIADGQCLVTSGPATGAAASVIVGADDLIRLVSGAVGWPELLAAGTLEMAGNPFLALRFPGLFRLPATRVGA